MEFKDLNISKQILMALEEAGFEHPTPIQEQAFPVIRSGRDMIGIATQQAAVYEGTDLLVATPGRFMDIYMNGMFRTGQIKTVVVDEADRLMDLGFMPQLRSILEVIPAKHQTLLFSATFSETVETMAHEFLTPDPIRIETAIQATPVEFVTQLRYDVPNIATKINLLKLLLADKETFRRVMVFTETKKNADRIVEKLADHWKGELSILHSNKAQNTRLNALNAFKKGETRIMVSSDVAARGIDVQDVSHVINFDIPSLPEEYVHRIGRTARAGKEGTAISFVSEKEEPKFDIIEQLIGQQVKTQRRRSLSPAFRKKQQNTAKGAPGQPQKKKATLKPNFYILF